MSAQFAREKSAWNRFNSFRRHLPGEQLFRQGSVASGVYFIISGYVKVSSLDRDGRQLIVGLRGAGSMLGAPSVILQEACPVSATAITNCETRFFPADVFTTLLKADPCFSSFINAEQSHLAHQLLDDILHFGLCSARSRLGELLWQLISANAGNGDQPGVSLRLPLRQWEVAQLIGITPEHLSRIAKQMQREGILEWRKGAIRVLDLNRLRDSNNR